MSVLYLNSTPIRFEPVNNVTSIFFDETNEQIFTVRSNGAAGVVVKCPDPEKNFSFRLQDKGAIVSVKLSPDQKMLAIQRTSNSVDYVVFDGVPTGDEFSHSCRSSNCQLVDFYWITASGSEVVYVTSTSVELYSVQATRRQLKPLRSYNCACAWSGFSWRSSLLVVGVRACMLAHGTVSPGGSDETPVAHLQPFVFNTAGGAHKAAKLEVDSVFDKGATDSLRLCDLTLCELYGYPYLLVMRHHRLSGGQDALPSHCLLYRLNSDNVFVRMAVLRLNVGGRFAVSVIDSVVVVHHQQSATSALYDVMLEGGQPRRDGDGDVSGRDVTPQDIILQPVCEPASIAAFTLQLSPQTAQQVDNSLVCQLYSSSWVVFQPHSIIDIKLGCYWRLCLDLAALPAVFGNSVRTLPDGTAESWHVRAVRFLLNRHGAKPVLLRILRRICEPAWSQTPSTLVSVASTDDAQSTDDAPVQHEAVAIRGGDDDDDVQRESAVVARDCLQDIATVMDLVNDQLRRHYQNELTSQMALPVSSSAADRMPPAHCVPFHISQAHLSGEVLQPMLDDATEPPSSPPISPLSAGDLVAQQQRRRRFKHVTNVLLEYVRSLHQCGLVVEFVIEEMLVQALVAAASFHALHQMVQYAVFSDSRQLACLLLSLKGVYPAAEQLAVDMLQRVAGLSWHEVVEVLLHRRDVTAALRLSRDKSADDGLLLARRALEPALALCVEQEQDTAPTVLGQCPGLAEAEFYATYRYFEARNIRLRGAPEFVAGQHCEQYVKSFHAKFVKPTVTPENSS